MTITTAFRRTLPLPASILILTACAQTPAPTPPSQPTASMWPATCPAGWTTPLAVPAGLVPPGPPLRVVGRASAKGTQNYRCSASPADGGEGAFGWTFIGPEATLADCNGATIGRHFASVNDGGSPKWQAEDGSFVVGKKIAAEPSGETGAVPWLLLEGAGGGVGPLGAVSYIQRTATKGGAVPPLGCDQARARAGTVAKVPYTADYWFFGPRP
jgi:Protein of unknown function (DUF3455)